LVIGYLRYNPAVVNLAPGKGRRGVGVTSSKYGCPGSSKDIDKPMAWNKRFQ